MTTTQPRRTYLPTLPECGGIAARALCVIGMLLSASLHADVLADQPAAATLPAWGWSAADYGITDAQMQASSLRAILEDHRADDVQPAPDLFSAASYVLLTLFAGGGGAPLDLVRPRDDLKEYLESVESGRAGDAKARPSSPAQPAVSP